MIISFKNNVNIYAKTSPSIIFKCVLWVLGSDIHCVLNNILNITQFILISSLTKEFVQASRFWNLQVKDFHFSNL